MILYPAIDILDGKAVRLTQGDFDAATVYDDDPLESARAWVDAGARALHVVDLDGARAGRPVSLDHLRHIAGRLDVPVQYGGGLRSLDALDAALDAGAARVVLGTAAFRDEELLGAAIARHGERIVVSVDVRGGRVATAGWTQTSETGADEAIERLQQRGVRRFVYTNVDRDGMLEGPDVDEIARVAALVEGELVYSGGIGELSHLEALARLRESTLNGVIVGKALYERRFTFGEGAGVLAGVPPTWARVLGPLTVAWSRRDVATLCELTAPDFELVPFTMSLVEHRTYRGHEGLRAYFDDVAATWESLEPELVDVLHHASDFLVGNGTLRARGRGSGVELETDLAYVFERRGDKLTSLRAYRDPAEALRSVGLE